MFVCQLVKYLFLRSFKRTVLLSWGSFSENQVSICQKQRMLSRSCFASFDFPVCLSRLICYYPHPISIIKLLICYYPLLPLMLHYRPSALFDCQKSIFLTLLRSARTSCTTFTSRPSILLFEIFFFTSLLRKYLFLSMYFYFYQLNRIAKLKSFTHQHQVAWLKNKKELNDYFLLFLLGRST